MRVRSVAHGVDDFITVPSRFLERNNSLVGLLDFIVQSSKRLEGIAGSYVFEDISNNSYARLLSGDGRVVKYFYRCSLKSEDILVNSLGEEKISYEIVIKLIRYL